MASRTYGVSFEKPDGSVISFVVDAETMVDAIKAMERYAPNAVALRVESEPTRSAFITAASANEPAKLTAIQRAALEKAKSDGFLKPWDHGSTTVARLKRGNLIRLIPGGMYGITVEGRIALDRWA